MLVGFEQKFSEQNQTGSPSLKTEGENSSQDVEKLPSEDYDDSGLEFENGPPSDDKKKFEGWFSQLEQQMLQKTDIRDRLDLLQRGIAKMETDKQQLLNLKFNEEIEIDFMIKPLKILPKGDNFKAQDCGDYRMKILSHFDPMGEVEIKDPSLKKAINVFKLICTN